MLVPNVEKVFKEKSEDNNEYIILNVNEDKYIDFRENYIDIMQDDGKALDKYIKYIESLVRKSFEYREYIRVLKTEFDLTKCAFFKNLDLNETNKVTLEMHHYPFTLYDICYIVLKNRMKDNEDDPGDQDKFNKVLNPFSIAKEVLRLHFEGKVGLVPMSLTPHELYHKGNLFIPLTKEYVFGNYDDFATEYDIYSIDNYASIYDCIIKKTEEILNSEEELNLDKLTIKKVYLQMGHTNFIKKIEKDNEENNEND